MCKTEVEPRGDRFVDTSRTRERNLEVLKANKFPLLMDVADDRRGFRAKRADLGSNNYSQNITTWNRLSEHVFASQASTGSLKRPDRLYS
jgi:hypothetical protein